MKINTPELDRFISYLSLQKGSSYNTVISYKNDISSFLVYLDEHFGAVTLTKVTTFQIKSWLASLRDANMSTRSLTRKITALKMFFKYHIKVDTVKTNPILNIHIPKSSKRLPEFVSENDMDTLFNYIVFPDTWAGKTDRLILEVLYSTGIRKDELVNLKESRIDISRLMIKVTGKGNKERLVPVNPNLITSMVSYMQAKRDNFKSFDGDILLVTGTGKKLNPRHVYTSVNFYLSKVTTIQKKSPHTLRHTFATHLMNKGAKIQAVQLLLGHTTPISTQIYTQTGISQLKNIHASSHPKG